MAVAVDREVILARGAAEAKAAGLSPSFSVRPGLVAAMLALYDALRRQRRQVDRFEEFLVDELAHSDDCGAVRLLAQTRFLADAFRRYEACLDSRHVDHEHRLCERLMAEPSPQPVRQVIVTVTDCVADLAGLWPSDFDLLARLPGLARLDVVATEARLGGGWLERVFEELPGIEEVPAPPARGERGLSGTCGRRVGVHEPRSRRRAGRLRPPAESGAPGRAARSRTRAWRWSCAARCRISTSRAMSWGGPAFPTKPATRCRWPPSRS